MIPSFHYILKRSLMADDSMSGRAEVHLAKYDCDVIEIQIAEDGFDPSTSGLWAQHASAAPLCCLKLSLISFIYLNIGSQV